MFKIKLGGIYIIEINDYYYIGKSTNVFERWNSHYTDLICKKHSSPLLQKMFDKYGQNEMTFKILEYVSYSDLKSSSELKGSQFNKYYNKVLLFKEKQWMSKYSINFALNNQNKYFIK